MYPHFWKHQFLSFFVFVLEQELFTMKFLPNFSFQPFSQIPPAATNTNHAFQNSAMTCTLGLWVVSWEIQKTSSFLAKTPIRWVLMHPNCQEFSLLSYFCWGCLRLMSGWGESLGLIAVNNRSAWSLWAILGGFPDPQWPWKISFGSGLIAATRLMI